MVLPSLFDLRSGFKMIGEYNYSKKFLYTEKLCGGVHGCIGFVPDKGSPYFVPDTSLQEDIRNLIVQPYKIIAILEKPITDKLYSTITDKKKGIYLVESDFVQPLKGKMDWDLLIARYGQ